MYNGIRRKSDAAEAIITRVLQLKQILQSSQVCVRVQLHTVASDSGGEFRSKRLSDALGKEGIVQEYTAVAEHNTNAVAERAVKQIREAVQMVLFEAGLPNNFLALSRNQLL